EEEGAGATATNGNGKKQPAMIVDEPPRPNPSTAQVMHSKVAQNVPVTTSGSSYSGGGGIQVVDATADRTRVLATPATRRLARQLGVEIGRVPATGKHGRVTTDDVRRFK